MGIIQMVPSSRIFSIISHLIIWWIEIVTTIFQIYKEDEHIQEKSIKTESNYSKIKRLKRKIKLKPAGPFVEQGASSQLICIAEVCMRYLQRIIKCKTVQKRGLRNKHEYLPPRTLFFYCIRNSWITQYLLA